MVAEAATRTRLGGHVVAETLQALGAEVAFGVPGVHALAMWEALRTGELRGCGARTELSAGFAADGYARSSGRPSPLLLSTGPGALNSLTAMMEAASAHVPVIAISSQIPRYRAVSADLTRSRRVCNSGSAPPERHSHFTTEANHPRPASVDPGIPGSSQSHGRCSHGRAVGSGRPCKNGPARSSVRAPEHERGIS